MARACLMSDGRGLAALCCPSGRVLRGQEVKNMIEQIVFGRCGAGLKDRVPAYWAKKRWRVSRLLTTFRHDQCDLQLTVGRDAGLTWREAMDQMVDRLTTELRRHRERIRHDDAYKRKNRRKDAVMRWRPQLASPGASRPQTVAR
jgi:hypothetical protein